LESPGAETFRREPNESGSREPAERDRRPQPRRLNADVSLAAALVCAAAIVRWHGFGADYLWRDDAWQSLVARADGLREFLLVAVTAPGYSALLAGWFALVGLSPTRAQLPAFVAGICGPAVVFLVARRLDVSRTAAIVPAVILVTSSFHVDYSVRVKPFTLELLIAAGLLVVALNGIQRGMNGRRWAVLVASSVAATVFSALLVPVVASCLAAAGVADLRQQRRRSYPRVVGAAALYGSFGVAWWWVVLRDVGTPALDVFWQDHFIGSDGGWSAVPLRLVHRSGSLLRSLVVPAGVSVSDGPAQLVALVVGGLVAVGIYLSLRRDLSLGLLLAGPVTVTFALSMLRIAPTGTGRTDLVLYPSLLAAMALAIDRAARHLHSHRRTVAWVGGAAAVTIVVVASLGARPYPPVPDARPLVAEVERQSGQDDVVVIADGLLTYEIALVSSWSLSIVPSERSMTGFHVDFPGRAAIIVEESYAVPLELEERRQDREAAKSLAPLVAAEDPPEHVWVFGTRRPQVREVLEARGYQVVSRREANSPLIPDQYQELTLWRLEAA
jgi:hypothetical protein